jgi:hypothetical protein
MVYKASIKPRAYDEVVAYFVRSPRFILDIYLFTIGFFEIQSLRMASSKRATAYDELAH